MLTLNMLTWSRLHTPGHTHGSPRDMSPLQPPSTRFCRPSSSREPGQAAGDCRSLPSFVQAVGTKFNEKNKKPLNDIENVLYRTLVTYSFIKETLTFIHSKYLFFCYSYILFP